MYGFSASFIELLAIPYVRVEMLQYKLCAGLSIKLVGNPFVVYRVVTRREITVKLIGILCNSRL